MYNIIEENNLLLGKLALKSLKIKSPEFRKPHKCGNNNVIISFCYLKPGDKNERCFNDELDIKLLKVYLKLFAFKDMKDMIIDVEKNDSIFSILNEYVQDGINVDYVRLYYHGSENVTDFGKFFESLNIVKDLEISHLCFGNREMVDKPIMSSLKGLERLKIKECSCTSFFNKDLLCKIYKDNPKLNVFGFMNPSNVPNVNIINAAIKNQYNAKNCFVGNEPHHTSLTFSVPEKYDLNVLKNEMDKNSPYIWKAKFDRDYTSLNLKSRRNCKRCASTKIALIVFKKRYRTEYNLVH